MFETRKGLRAGSSAIDFTQLGHQKCFGTKQKTEISNSLVVFYLVPKHFLCPNWVNSIADDPALKSCIDKQLNVHTLF